MIIDQLQQAIDGEYEAIVCYEQLARLAPKTAQKERILAIRADELRHFETFSALYYALTGTAPSPKRPQPCPKTFQEGVRAAFQDEQEASFFYKQTAASTAVPAIKRAFSDAALDEQRHAVWFLSFFS